MADKPEALRLADALEVRGFLGTTASDAAAELRRLHAVNQELLNSLKFYAAMMGRRKSDGEPFYMHALDLDCGDRARAAVAKVEEQK
jgi:hypothetical protein